MTIPLQTFIALLLISASGIGGVFAGHWQGESFVYSQLLNNMQQAVAVVGVRK